VKGIDTKAAQGTKRKAEVKLFVFEQYLSLVFVKNLEDQLLDRWLIKRLRTSRWRQCTVNPQHRRQTNLDVQVRCPLFYHFF
jgi:ABC-type uncharacterized transport system fused permease/ATPase subunit